MIAGWRPLAAGSFRPQDAQNASVLLKEGVFVSARRNKTHRLMILRMLVRQVDMAFIKTMQALFYVTFLYGNHYLRRFYRRLVKAQSRKR